MQEPIYLVPQHLLFAVQAHGSHLRDLTRRLGTAVATNAPAELVEQLRDEHRFAGLEYTSAILLAAAEGATSAELVGYGVSADLAAELDRRARQ